MRSVDDLVGRYEYKPIVVEAIRVTHENVGQVTEWLQATDYWVTVNRFYIKRRDIFEKKWEGRFGDWIFKNHDGEYYIMSAESFREIFNPEGLARETILDGLGQELESWPKYDH